MTRICGNPQDFAATGLRAFAQVFQHLVRPVPGGVVRATPGAPGKVTLLVGGGSGHYPAFCGYVGDGFADAAVAGDIFASPSTQAILNVARAAHRGGGVVMGFGNYAGDNLNFGIAAERLREEGIDTRIVATTDDVASAGPDAAARRRGVAGDLPVYKIMGAAAEEGLDISRVEAVGRHANARTRSFGIAFDGCTLPGETDTLFHVPAGRMALGLGIHGEAGLATVDLASPAEIARLLFEPVVAEGRGLSGRVAVLLNGLGATKMEELLVLWAALEPLFAAEGLAIVAPLVGEYVTSLDMAGCSLTVTWLDDALERYWRAAVDCPALRRPQVDGEWRFGAAHAPEMPAPITAPAPTEAGRAAGACIAGVMAALATALAEAEEMLGRIDAQAGDGDHGQSMARGSAAAAAAATRTAAGGAGAGGVLAAAADAWADRAGGTSGALWGEGLRAFSTALSDAARPDADATRRGARAMLARITQLGGAKPGDKTMVDALVPFVDTLEASLGAGHTLAHAWSAAAAAAQAAADATRAMLPRLGRARIHGEASRGYPDAGALSLALCTRVVGATLTGPG